MNPVEPLEDALELVRKMAECLGFHTVSNTTRTITLSPKDRNALNHHSGLIFDVSIMNPKCVTQFIDGKIVKISTLISEDWCLMIKLNNSREQSMFVYEVTDGSSLLSAFCLFIRLALNNQLTSTPEVLVKELTRPILRSWGLPDSTLKIEQALTMRGWVKSGTYWERAWLSRERPGCHEPTLIDAWNMEFGSNQ